jgi:prevent-host-death family protein
MRAIGAFEAKNKLSMLLDAVERGEEVVITRHGKAVARLIPDRPGHDASRAQEAAARIRARAEKLKGAPFDWQEWKRHRDDGRP